MNPPAFLRPSCPLPSARVTPASQFSDFCHALSASDRRKLISQDRDKKSTNCKRRLTALKTQASPIRSAATQTESLPTKLDVLEKTEPPNVFKTSKPKKKLADIWREIQGANNWEGLLDSMDDILRKEIIRYGEFAQASYDAFDFDPFSKYCGSCKYNRRELFQGVGMSDDGYEVTKYLYATSNINLPGFFQSASVQKHWSTHANWMGFIAVTTDEKEIKRLGRRDIVRLGMNHLTLRLPS